MNDGLWHHVTYVRAGHQRVALPGRLFGFDQVDSGGRGYFQPSPLVAGRQSLPGFDGTKRFTGLLDEIKIYQMALAPEQVTAGRGTSAHTHRAQVGHRKVGAREQPQPGSVQVAN
jgi:hypothetical protein